MKKVFRFQYEPCVGTCYAHSPIFFSELKKAPQELLTSTIDKIVAAHDSTCDDITQRFGVDYDEANNIYVGSFMNGTRLDLFSDKSFLTLANILSSHVLKENEGKAVSSADCKFGENGNENLAELILTSVAAA